jgi:multiple sugar transport system substrate-binding protein
MIAFILRVVITLANLMFCFYIKLYVFGVIDFCIELFDNQNRSNLSDDVADTRNRGSWLFLKHLFSLEVQSQFYAIAPFLLSHRQHLSTLIDGDEILMALSDSIQYSREKEYVPFAPKWHSDLYQEMGGFFIIDPASRRPATEVLTRMQNFMIQKKDQYCTTNVNGWGC